MGKKNNWPTDPGFGRGLYLHIPFCRQACRYCDFYFTVSLRYLDPFVESLGKEIMERRDEIAGELPVTSIYLGGGTPSLLQAGQLGSIMERVQRHYPVAPGAEITIECNPDDLTPERLQLLRRLGFNRLSIGIQSFHDRDLELLRRSHDAGQAERSIREAASAGFDNLNVDLIYGIPGQTGKQWMMNLEKLEDLPVNHVSAYHLTFETGTVFDHWRKKGRIVPVHEQESVSLYRILRKVLVKRGFDHYEISNFALGRSHSRHNLVYWTGAVYQGFGPSAHSYNGNVRKWNIPSLKKYLEGTAAGKQVFEDEELTPAEAYHDYLITSLRTRYGADPGVILEHFGEPVRTHFDRASASLLSGGLLESRDGRMIIPPGQWLLTDLVLRDLFLDAI